MYKTDIEMFQDLIKEYESALKYCHGSEDIKFYRQHLEVFKKKLKELENNEKK